MTVGVLLRMDPGWHTYWVNPGESGLATNIHWTIPSGVVSLRPPLAAPRENDRSRRGAHVRLCQRDDALATVQLPATMPAQGAVKLQAEVSWLECEKTCVPGSATVTLTIPIGEQSTPSADAPRIARYRATIPRPPNKLDDVAVSVTSAADTMTIVVTPSSGAQFALNGADAPDFFPFREFTCCRSHKYYCDGQRGGDTHPVGCRGEGPDSRDPWCPGLQNGRWNAQRSGNRPCADTGDISS